jgi:hypothetical protein
VTGGRGHPAAQGTIRSDGREPVTAETDTEQRTRPPRTRWAILGALAAVLVILPAVVFFAVPPTTSPWADKTGVPPGLQLTRVDGDIDITEPGTILDSVDVHGQVVVLAPDVIIRNSIIRGDDGGTNGGVIDAMAGEANLQVIDSELFATAPSPYVNGIMGSNFTLTRVDIHDVIDQVHVVGDNVTITRSWLHDNLHYDEDPVHDGGPSHDDNVQIQIGRNITIQDSSLSGAWNAVVQITQDRGEVADVTLRNNEVDNGWCSINVAEDKYGSVSGVTVTDNTFGRNTRRSDCAIIAPPTSPVELEGNRFTDGDPVRVRRGD